MKPFVPSSQRNVPVLRRSLLSLAVVGALLGVQQAEAGAFAVPTYGTPGWGRAFAGGSLWHNDPAAAYNNPAAMAFIERPVGQISAIYADIDLKFKGKPTITRGALVLKSSTLIPARPAS